MYVTNNKLCKINSEPNMRSIPCSFVAHKMYQHIFSLRKKKKKKPTNFHLKNKNRFSYNFHSLLK